MLNPTLHVRILSPQKLLLDTQASSVTSVNVSGKFDVLPLHANFISLIEGKPIEIRCLRQKKPLIFTFPIAILVCLDNQVNIYTYSQ